ncbi:rRNA-processing protein efg1 [Colletotrichum truncatum]|uniref:rRNA-processing protein efg1 n=1 Tax=Colletotrichum truncatum TaxID=5467 RepID=A0ACC3YIW0_COLTU|nr:rRNA-processing protein efg1 [Colletotrichum truncatum]KAF6794324.1 rRNA-processing protein efg1 [Colletotrichum truncatum]
MGAKRSHSEVSDVAMQEVSDQRHDSPATSENGGQPATKRSRTGPGATKKKHKAKEGTTAWNKTRARTIRRLLQSGKELPATVRNDLEQELEALQERVGEHDFKKKRSHMIQKYHMVRFFERKKAERLLKQLRKKIAQSTDEEEKKRLEAEAHVAEVDVAYARFFPLMERYESLYPNKDKDGNADDTKTDEKSEEQPFKQPKALRALHAERPKMWATIEKTLPGGETALYRLRDRKSPTDTGAAPGRPAKKNIPKINKAKASFPAEQHHHHHKDRAVNWKSEGKARKWQAPAQQDEDEDDGTGFFE